MPRSCKSKGCPEVRGGSALSLTPTQMPRTVPWRRLSLPHSRALAREENPIFEEVSQLCFEEVS